MPAVALTTRSVFALKPRRGRKVERFFDKARGAPKGFALRVTANGARGFYLVARIGTSDSKQWLYLGAPGTLAHPEVTLAEAYAKARAARELLDKGIDPRAEQERVAREHALAAEAAKRAEALSATRPTLSVLVVKFIEAQAGTYKAKTIAEYKRLHKAHIEVAVLGSVLAADVKRHQLRALLEGIRGKVTSGPDDERTTYDGTPVVANRLQQLVRAAYSWGINEEIDDALESNPAAGYEVSDEQRMPDEERTLSADEVRDLWRGLDAKDDKGKRLVTIEAASYLRLLLLCGLRRTEAALADWKDVDLEAGEWRIPAANRKAAGRRRKKARHRDLTVPLSKSAKAILTSLQTITGTTGPVFGAAATTVRVNPHRFMKRPREVAGFLFSLHDLRATCATGAGETGAPPHIVSVILGHTELPGAAEATPGYDRSRRLDEVRAALERWAHRVALDVRAIRKRA
jgi:integrase